MRANDGGNDIELSKTGANVYDSLQERDSGGHTYASVRGPETISKSNTKSNLKCHSDSASGNASMVDVKFSGRTLCVLATFGILLLCTLCSIITGVIVYVVTSAKYEQNTAQCGKDVNYSSGSVVENVKELEDKLLTRVNDELKALRTNHTESREQDRGDLNVLKDEVETLRKSFKQDTGDIKTLQEDLESLENNYTESYMAVNGKLDALENVSHSMQEIQSASGQQIVFYVHTPTGNLVQGSPTFKTIVENIGSGYNTSTGRFRGPVAGVYTFSITLFSTVDRTRNQLYCYILRNTDLVGKVSSYTGLHDSASTSLFIHLSAGDVIALQCFNWQYAYNKDIHISFTGALFKVD